MNLRVLEVARVYNYFRDYDPATGRYVESDPIGLHGELNTYGYAAADPVAKADPWGLYWVYSQSTGKLHQVDNTTRDIQFVAKGYSGHGPGLNKPSYQRIPNIGPPPRGLWKIEEPFNSPNVGPYALPLTPQAGTHVFERDLFRIHGDNAEQNLSASNGCLIFDRPTRERIWRSGDRDLLVIP